MSVYSIYEGLSYRLYLMLLNRSRSKLKAELKPGQLKNEYVARMSR